MGSILPRPVSLCGRVTAVVGLDPGILRGFGGQESGEVLDAVPIRSPWIRYAAADESGEYLAMVSYFRLKGVGAMPKFLWNALRIGRQLGRSEGLVY